MQTQTTQKENYFLSQPHQPFFLLGVVNAIIFMLLFALAYKGVIALSIDTLSFHTYSLIFFLFSNVFTGFLFTTFPRFNQSSVIEKNYYISAFSLSLLSTLLFIVGSLSSSGLVAIAMFINILSHALILYKLQSIYLVGASLDKNDSYWILLAHYFGLGANVLFTLSLKYPELLSIAIHISFYLYIIFLALSVAQRMVPFFSHSFAEKNEELMRYVFTLFLIRVVAGSFEFLPMIILSDALLGVILLKEFLRWELKPLSAPSILWVLHLALFWLPLAFLLSAMSTTLEFFYDISFYYLEIHLLSIGFLTTLLIGFGTRVTLGHSGQAPHGDALASKIFLFIQAIVLMRALYSVNIALGWELNFLFDISFTLWITLFGVWGWRYGRVLLFGSKL